MKNELKVNFWVHQKDQMIIFKLFSFNKTISFPIYNMYNKYKYKYKILKIIGNDDFVLANFYIHIHCDYNISQNSEN
jgi:hypothetical protein